MRRPKGLKYKIKVKNRAWFQKGFKPWNTGTKGKIKPNSGNFKRGEHRSLKTEFKKGDTAKNKNIKWKGGISFKYRTLYQGLKYKRWRIRIFERDNWTCQTCGKRSKIGECIYLEAHHIKSFNKFLKLRYKLENGITLCRECHKLIHYKKNV